MEDVNFDNQYIAYLFLEVLYKEGKIDRKTYENVLRLKEEYIKKYVKEHKA